MGDGKYIHTFSLIEFMDYELAKTIVFIINVCIYLSYPLNFAIYCGMSRYRVKIFLWLLGL